MLLSKYKVTSLIRQIPFYYLLESIYLLVTRWGETKKHRYLSLRHYCAVICFHSPFPKGLQTETIMDPI